MKYSVIFPLCAMVCYAIANLVIEQKLAKSTSSLNIVFIYSSITALFSFSLRFINKTNTITDSLPTGEVLAYCVVVGLLFFSADYFYATAYTNGASLLTVTPLIALVPVFATLVKFTLTGELPNIWHALGFVFALISVYLVTKGNAVAAA